MMITPFAPRVPLRPGSVPHGHRVAGVGPLTL